MSIWISRNGQNHGPYSLDQLQEWLKTGQVKLGDMAWAEGDNWRPLGDVLRANGVELPPSPPPPPPMQAPVNRTVELSLPPMPQFNTAGLEPDTLAQRLATYEKCSGIAWMVLGAIQCITVVAIIAGIWNIVAGYSRIQSSPLIAKRDPQVPAMFESYVGLIIIGLVNLFLGGFIGVIMVGVDFYIRHIILSNRKIFEQPVQDEETLAV